MLGWNLRFKQSTAIVLLATLCWVAGGGQAWAQGEAVERSPERVLANLADDPRLNLSSDEREALRRAAAALEPRQPVVLRRHSERRAALELSLLADELRTAAAPAGTGDAVAGRARLAARAATLEERAERAYRDALEGSLKTGERLRSAGVPEVKLRRHAAAEAELVTRMEAVMAELAIARSAGDADTARAALAAAEASLAGTGEGRPHTAFDPGRLPFRAVEPVWREPGPAPATAQGRSLEGPPRRALAEVEAPLRVVATSQGPPTAADLAPTSDAQITPQVQALAAQLEGRPLAIFDWVRNHVETYPTWGSVQGSQATLVGLRGNAFDQASLLVALLRASGVPARWVTGTIQVPVEQVQNWVGGAPTPNVAQQILGTGGIDNVGLTSGGVVQAIRLDHVWVEAWIDNVPSRGVVQGEGDSWLPLDPSFKQHTFSPPSEVYDAVPLADFIDTGDLPFTVDESLGRISGVDTAAFDEQLLAWVEASDAYLVANGEVTLDAEETYQDVLGRQRIVQSASTVFPASLPYAVVDRDGAFSDLPASLRHSIELRGFPSQLARALGSPSFNAAVSLPELSSRRLGLRFEPATQADADVLEAARTSGASSLPVYLVDVAPSVQLDGAEIASGGSVVMGSVFYVDAVLRAPGGATTVPFQVTAGDEIVVGVTGNGVLPAMAEARFQAHPVDGAPEYLHQVQLHYWSEVDQLGGVAARGLGVHPLRLPSVGLFSSPLTVSYFFGTPRTGVYQGSVMDVQQSLVGGAAVDRDDVTEWVKQSGHYGSYLEGSVFEQLASAASGEPRAVGISSIHLIAAAMAQGVPVYHVTAANRAAVLPLLQLDPAVEADVDSAVRQGQTALVPERNLDMGAWRGVGYILQDPETGGGAYLISGGAAGGGLLDCLEELVPKFLEVLQFILALLIFLLLIALIIAAIAGSAGTLAPAGAAAAVALFFLLLWRGGGPTTTPTTA